ncbi:MAG TPA: hypothetical protein VF520_06260 [Thermoleophilaceae bacterium]|jgi:hypothetical protein
MKRYLVLPVSAAALALAASAAPAQADDTLLARCPDGYAPLVFLVATEEDRNGNGIVCAKATPGGNTIVHDDPNGQPYRCNGIVPPPDCVEDVVDDLT